MEKLIKNESNKYARNFYVNLYKEGYSLLGDSRYHGVRGYVDTICPKGHIYTTTPENFNSVGTRCSTCSGYKRKTTEQFKQEIYELVGDEYSVLGEYVNDSKHIEIKHNTCGYEYKVIPSNFLRGRRCGKCVRPNYNRDTKQFKQEVYNLVKNEYTVLGEYKGANTHIKMIHNKCGYTWNTTPANFLSETRCPHCQSSKGEKLVESILKENNLTYIPQDKFEECRNKLPLPFDFGVYKEDELIALIEYQGEQHYRPTDFFGGEEGFKYRQHNDNIKRKFCKENNIPLIEIKYTLTNEEVECFLLEKLTEYLG